MITSADKIGRLLARFVTLQLFPVLYYAGRMPPFSDAQHSALL